MTATRNKVTIPRAVRQRAAQEGAEVLGMHAGSQREIKRTASSIQGAVRDAYLVGWVDGRDSLAGLLTRALRAIDDELHAMTEDEWKQHPTMRRKAKLCDEIQRALREMPAVCPNCGKPAAMSFGDGSGLFSSACLDGTCTKAKP